ncbi:MAG: InlB B-repeat-containing protein [Anaerolineales bacterium]|nr:InlB B-repeat-containing protein [Anaerolineales bacterium]
MPASDITLYAKWTANSYTITFNSNGGSAVAAITQPFGSVVSAPTAPTKAGNTFAGWYSDAGLTTAYTFTTMPAADITLYAKWTTLPTHTVTFNANGGTGTMAPQVANVPTALTLNTFTRTGYTFAGWNTLANGTGTNYATARSTPSAQTSPCMPSGQLCRLTL